MDIGGEEGGYRGRGEWIWGEGVDIVGRGVDMGIKGSGYWGKGWKGEGVDMGGRGWIWGVRVKGRMGKCEEMRGNGGVR